MFDFYGVFEEHGVSPATHEEWQNVRTTHDQVWMFLVTSSFTERAMRDFMHEHKDAKVLAKNMDMFIEELQRQTGLPKDETAHAAYIGHIIDKDRRWVNDPEGARDHERQMYEEDLDKTKDLEDRLSNDDLPDELGEMARDLADVLKNRHDEQARLNHEIQSLEYSLESSEMDSTFSLFEEILGINKEEDQQ